MKNVKITRGINKKGKFNFEIIVDGKTGTSIDNAFSLLLDCNADMAYDWKSLKVTWGGENTTLEFEKSLSLRHSSISEFKSRIQKIAVDIDTWKNGLKFTEEIEFQA